MITKAYTTPELARQVAHASGVPHPLTCPPLYYEHHDLTLLLFYPQPPHLLYLALHGLPDQPYLYGTDWITALGPDTFNNVNLSRTTIYAPVCHLDASPLLPIILATHPHALIIGSGENFSPYVHKLGRTLRILLSLNFTPPTALKLARAHLSLYSDHPAALDTLTLHTYTPDPPPTPKET